MQACPLCVGTAAPSALLGGFGVGAGAVTMSDVGAGAGVGALVPPVVLVMALSTLGLGHSKA